MSILLTGGAGYIGSHTAIELLENNDLVVIDDFSNSKPEVLDAIKEITNKEVTFYEGDYSDKDFLDKAFSENEITDKGFRPFETLFYKNSSINQFDVSCNFLTNNGIINFSDTIVKRSAKVNRCKTDRPSILRAQLSVAGNPF